MRTRREARPEARPTSRRRQGIQPSSCPQPWEVLEPGGGTWHPLTSHRASGRCEGLALSCPFPRQVGGGPSGLASPPGEDPERGPGRLLSEKEGTYAESGPCCQHGRAQAGRPGGRDPSLTPSSQRASLPGLGPWPEGCTLRPGRRRACKPREEDRETPWMGLNGRPHSPSVG